MSDNKFKDRILVEGKVDGDLYNYIHDEIEKEGILISGKSNDKEVYLAYIFCINREGETEWDFKYTYDEDKALRFYDVDLADTIYNKISEDMRNKIELN